MRTERFEMLRAAIAPLYRQGYATYQIAKKLGLTKEEVIYVLHRL